MESEEQKFLAQSARKQIRELAREVRAAEEIVSGIQPERGAESAERGIAPEPANTCNQYALERAEPGARGAAREQARAAFARASLLFRWLSKGGDVYPASLQRWEAAFAAIDRMFSDGTRGQAIQAALNTLRYAIAERAELPMGEEAFLVRRHDRALPGGAAFPCACVLDNIRSAFNCGSLIRSAEGFGAELLCLTGITPGPENAKVAKTAMGAGKTLRIERHRSLCRLIQEMRDRGRTIYALETAEGARPLFTEEIRFPLCAVLGNEEYGLDEGILSLADRVLEIPMFGCKNSLNVAVSGSIFLYEARRQWHALRA